LQPWTGRPHLPSNAVMQTRDSTVPHSTHLLSHRTRQVTLWRAHHQGWRGTFIRGALGATSSWTYELLYHFRYFCHLSAIYESVSNKFNCTSLVSRAVLWTSTSNIWLVHSTPPFQSLNVLNTKESFKLALLHKRIYTNKRVFSKFL
jgi:hypothetical protein